MKNRQGDKKCVKACNIGVNFWDTETMKLDGKYPEEFAECSCYELNYLEEAFQFIPINPAPISECYPRSHFPKFVI